MSELDFEWDENKSTSNTRKHKISFEEASTAFFDDNAIVFGDPDHSEYEERFLLLGMSRGLKVLVIAHCYKNSESTIRIISARKANKTESKTYFKGERK